MNCEYCLETINQEIEQDVVQVCKKCEQDLILGYGINRNDWPSPIREDSIDTAIIQASRNNYSNIVNYYVKHNGNENEENEENENEKKELFEEEEEDEEEDEEDEQLYDPDCDIYSDID